HGVKQSRAVEWLAAVGGPCAFEDEGLVGCRDLLECGGGTLQPGVSIGAQPPQVERRQLEGGAELADGAEGPSVIMREALVLDCRQVPLEAGLEAPHRVVLRPAAQVPAPQIA